MHQEIFKFKDFKPKQIQSLQSQRKSQMKRERLSMDGMITAHFLKQKTKMNFE